MQSELERLEKSENIEWREYRIGELFDIQNTLSFNKDKLVAGNEYDYVTRTSQNQGILQSTGFVNEENINASGTWSLGLLQMDFFYRQKPWYAGQFVRKVIAKRELSKKVVHYFTVLLNKQKKDLLAGLVRDVDETFLNAVVKLPVHLGLDGKSEIAFDFMEKFIATLEAERIATLEAERIATVEAYLSIVGLKDYLLTAQEEIALKNLENARLEEFRIGDVFDNVVQGRRLTKQDQMIGNLPFVMSGTVNTGIANYISNDVRVFPSNSLTVDIFGSVFYRNYEYGMGDDTGAYWSKDEHFSKFVMLYLASTMEKTLKGKFDFGHKLRSSRSLDIKLKLPIKPDKTPDYAFMENFVSAMQKIVIKNVVEYLDQRIEKTETLIH